MVYKKIIPYINTENELAANVMGLARSYSDGGADELILYNFSKDENSKEEFIKLSKQIGRIIDIPFIVGCNINNFEDAKRALYTGASGILLSYNHLINTELIKDLSSRFGENKIYLDIDQSVFVEDDSLYEKCTELGVGTLVINHRDFSDQLKNKLEKSPVSIIIHDSLKTHDIRCLLEIPNVSGVTTNFYKNKDIMKAKQSLKQDNIAVNVLSKLPFAEFKLNKEGLIPVVTQDYRTNEVLMLAYMNEEA